MRTAKDFEGLWLLRRHIDDRATDQVGTFTGTAVFRPRERHVLAYTETGKLKLGNGPVMEAQRAYLWRFGSRRVDVFFDDERPFHSFDPNGNGAGTDHLCGDDLYRVQYDFRQWPVWDATWDVRGPRKDYTSVSQYMRQL